MTDPGEDICDALVEYLNTLQTTAQDNDEEKPFGFTFEAKKTQDIQEEFEREHADLKVFFAPFGETEHKAGRGGEALITWDVSMLVVRRLDVNGTREQLNGLVYSIRRNIRRSRLKMAGRTYVGAETVIKSTPAETSQRMQFVSVTRLSYEGMD